MAKYNFDEYSVALIISAFVLNALSCGISHTFGLYYVIFLDVFKESSALTSWVGSINFALECAAGPIVSLLAMRIGLRATGMIGGLLTFVGLFITIFASNIYFVIVSLGVITGFGFGFVWTTCTVMIPLHFDNKHRPIALIISQCGIGFGSTLYPILGEKLLEVYGWRGCMLITSAISLHMVAASIIIRPQSMSPSSSSKEATAVKVDYWGLWTNWRYLVSHVHCFLVYFGLIAFGNHISSYAARMGHSPTISIRLISIIGLSGIFTRIILSLPLTFNWTRPCYLLALTTLVPAISHFVIATWTSFPVICVASVFHGFLYCAVGPPFFETIIVFLGTENFSIGYGFLEVSMAAGSLAGPPVGGLLVDLTGDYSYSFYASGVSLVIAAFCALSLRWSGKRRHRGLSECPIIQPPEV